MTDRLFIVQVCPYVTTYHGDYRYRIGQPSEALAALPGVSVANVSTTSPCLFDVSLAADVLILHLLREPDLLPLMAERRRLGRPTVYEIPDNFMAVPRHIASLFDFGQALSLSLNFQLIRCSDAIQAVSDILLEKYGFLHDSRLRFENHVLRPGPSPRPIEDRIVLGWGGSVGHTEDLRWIAPAISALCRERGDVSFSFMGDRGQFDEVFGPLDGKDRFHYTPPGSLDDYFRFLDTLDIGLAPLLESPFNICRSDVKFIEYASRGVLPLLSDVAPYRVHARDGENALLFRDPDHMSSIVLGLLEDRERLQRIRSSAYRYVAAERIEQQNAPLRLQAYQGMAQGRTPGIVPMDRLLRLSSKAELYGPEPSTAEQKTLQGLDLQGNGQSPKAHRLWEEAAGEDPGYAVPCLLLAQALTSESPSTAESWAREALARHPKSVRANLILGNLLQRRDHKGARRAYEQALDLFPDFAPAWRALALMESEEDRPEEAARLLDRALQGNPFDAGVAFDLGKTLAGLERTNQAAQAFQVAAGLIPDHPDYTLELVKALVRSGDFKDAVEACREFLLRNPENGVIREILEAIASRLGHPGHTDQPEREGEPTVATRP